MTQFQNFSGVVIDISDFPTGDKKDMGCYKIFSLEDDGNNIVNFVISPSTFFLNNYIMTIGDLVTGFYDTSLPTPLIFPPRFQAVLMAKQLRHRFIKIDSFNDQLISSDGTLKLNIGPYTKIQLTNGQPFTGHLAGRNLVVVYSITTRSIPAQTTPERIVVLC